MTPTPCIISVAITRSLPKKSDNPVVPISVASGSIRRTRRSGWGDARPLARSQGRRHAHLRARMFRRGVGRHPQVHARNDHAGFDGRPLGPGQGAWRDALPAPRYDLARHKLGELPDPGLRQPARPSAFLPIPYPPSDVPVTSTEQAIATSALM